MPPPLEGDFNTDKNGQFGLSCFYINGSKAVIIGFDSIFNKKDYLINDTVYKNIRVSLFNQLDTSFCRWVGSYYNFESIVGKAKLNKVDVPNGIFSGTFEFTIKTKDCGNYEVTNGRFDYKF